MCVVRARDCVKEAPSARRLAESLEKSHNNPCNNNHNDRTPTSYKWKYMYRFDVTWQSGGGSTHYTQLQLCSIVQLCCRAGHAHAPGQSCHLYCVSVRLAHNNVLLDE